MNLITVIAVLAVSLLLTLVFVVGFKSRGPWGSGWTFFTIVCLWLAAVSLWIPPAAPVWFGAPWIDLLLTGLLISFVLSATSSDATSSRWQKGHFSQSDLKQVSDTDQQHDRRKVTSVRSISNGPPIHEATTSRSPAAEVPSQTFRVGSFFWMLLLCLCALIIIGAA